MLTPVMRTAAGPSRCVNRIAVRRAVEVGFAPETIAPLARVHRREIYDQIRDANQSAVVRPEKLAAVTERLKNAR